MQDKLIAARRVIDTLDRKMARLFVARMDAVKDVAEYKHEKGIDIFDAKREAELLEKNSLLVPEEYRGAYREFLKKLMSISKEEQHELIEEMRKAEKSPTILRMHLGENSYPIFIGKGIIEGANEYFNLDRKVFIVTDDGVPADYANTVKSLCKSATVYTIKSGEASKSFTELHALLSAMSDFRLGRGDCVIAVGGGVVGDLAGFASSVYMRGVDFYNVPTTLLSQVDSSVGGKTAINLDGVKNTIGAFKQPKAVIIDINTLTTLPKRHLRNGMAEIIKIAAIANEELFAMLEKMDEDNAYENMEAIVTKAVETKRTIVEADEKEGGLRRILNFGHTLGHALEATNTDGKLHGECVAIGMIPVSSAEARERILHVLEKFALNTTHVKNAELIHPYIVLDKKASEDKITIVFCERIGEYSCRNMTVDEFISIV